MKLPLLFVSGVFSLVSFVACTAPSEEEDTESAEAEIITFPASVFANATPIAYGQTLPNETFLKANKFNAAKFTAAAGERLTGTVTAAGKKSIVYVVRKEGTKYVNVKAGGVSAAAPNIVIHTVEQPGEYFLVYRTVPRVDASFSVKLEKAGGLSACADAGQTPSLSVLAGAVKDGEVPKVEPVRYVYVVRSACTYATGCTVTKVIAAQVPSFSYLAKKSGANFVVQSQVVEAFPTLSASGILSGHVSVPRDDRDRFATELVPIRGTVGPTCMSIEETFKKVPVDEETYIEFRIQPQSPDTNPLPSVVHAPADALPVHPDLETMPDEDVLSRFPRGATTLTFARKQPLIQGTSVGDQRYCHPLTSCSALEPVTVRAQDNSACMRYSVQSNGNFLVVEGAKVIGRDGYALVTNRGLIPIEDGIGKVGDAVLRVGETSLQLTFPARNVSLEHERYQEVTNTSCTFNFAWPAMQ